MKSCKKHKQYNTVGTVYEDVYKTQAIQHCRNSLWRRVQTTNNTTLSEQFQNPIENRRKRQNRYHNTKIHVDRLLSWLYTDTSIKSGGVILVYFLSYSFMLYTFLCCILCIVNRRFVLFDRRIVLLRLMSSYYPFGILKHFLHNLFFMTHNTNILTLFIFFVIVWHVKRWFHKTCLIAWNINQFASY